MRIISMIHEDKSFPYKKKIRKNWDRGWGENTFLADYDIELYEGVRFQFIVYRWGGEEAFP